MTDSWIKFIKKINAQIEIFNKDGCDIVCYRGHADKNWNLSPTLFIKKEIHNMTDQAIYNIESVLYFDFVTNAGNLLKSNLDDWETLFIMRHHGIPTRVLDWTESFGTALYFALNGDGETPTIWMLDPYELNKISYEDASIPNPKKDLKYTYSEAFLEKTKEPFINPIVIVPPRTSERLFAQKGLFTLQGSDKRPLNLIPELKNSFKKFEIPLDAISDAKWFLKLAGINHYSIFPDLDGLSKHLTETSFL